MLEDYLEDRKCDKHNDYSASRSPTTECEGCWGYYNLVHDLPEGNTTPKSRFDKIVRVSERIPYMKSPDLSQFSGNKFERMSKWMDSRDTTTVCVGIDASLRSTGIASVVRDERNGEWYVHSTSDGFDLPQDAEQELKINRQISIVESCVNFFEIFSDDSNVPVFIEDHAYSRAHTNRATEAHELHGVIKSQFYLLSGMPVIPVGIKSARAEVFCHGSPSGDIKQVLFNALGSANHKWMIGLTDDEIDAWTVCAFHVKKVHPFGLT